jgi:ubiquinone/menaquinone biosynthesis C-methylase UbiE
MSEEHSEVSEDSIFFFEKQEVIVNDFDASRLILDIGGGGEGIIGQMKGKQVVAIDPNRRELEGAADGPLKIVMDAGDMLFLDDSFDVVTSFFTLMYIKGPEHEKIFEEVFRVLVSGGRFLIWDVDLPRCLDEEKDIVAFYLNIKLPDREIETGYGTKWPEQRQGLLYYKEIAGRVGFIASDHKENGRVFYLELQKP